MLDKSRIPHRRWRKRFASATLQDSHDQVLNLKNPSANDIHLNELQRAAYDLAITGHNVLITGQCGTGKSHVLR